MRKNPTLLETFCLNKVLCYCLLVQHLSRQILENIHTPQDTKMKLKHLFIVRCAKRTHKGCRIMGSEGIKQMKAFAEFARAIIGEKGKIRILTSPSLQARQSAREIANALGLSKKSVETNEILRSSETKDPQLIEALALIKLQEDEFVIIVTDLRYSKEFHRYFCDHVLEFTEVSNNVLEKGEAWSISCSPPGIKHYCATQKQNVA